MKTDDMNLEMLEQDEDMLFELEMAGEKTEELDEDMLFELQMAAEKTQGPQDKAQEATTVDIKESSEPIRFPTESYTDYHTVVRNIKIRTRQLGLTVKDVEDKCNLGENFLDKAEEDKSLLTMPILTRIAKMLHAKPETFILVDFEAVDDDVVLMMGLLKKLSTETDACVTRWTPISIKDINDALSSGECKYPIIHPDVESQVSDYMEEAYDADEDSLSYGVGVAICSPDDEVTCNGGYCTVINEDNRLYLFQMRDSAEDEFFVLYLNNMLMLDTRKNGRLFLSEVDELFHIIPRHHDEFRLDPVAKEFLEEYVSFEMFRSGLYY